MRDWNIDNGGAISVSTAFAMIASVVFASQRDQKPIDSKESAEPVIERIASDFIDPFYRLGPTLYSGAQPKGEAGFAELERLGVTTVISVDGVPPDVKSARAHGIRYVHVPLSYAAIEPGDAARIVRTFETSAGRVFIHCHHGRFRGPAAAALCGRASGFMPDRQAAAWLAMAGLKPEEYPDLSSSALESRLPVRATLDAINPEELPEQVEVADLIERMVEIDTLRDALREVDSVRPANERAALARQLHESLRESARLPIAVSRGERFLTELSNAAELARSVDEAIQAGEADQVARLLDSVSQSCVDCHRSYRNRRVQPPKGP